MLELVLSGGPDRFVGQLGENDVYHPTEELDGSHVLVRRVRVNMTLVEMIQGTTLLFKTGNLTNQLT